MATALNTALTALGAFLALLAAGGGIWAALESRAGRHAADRAHRREAKARARAQLGLVARLAESVGEVAREESGSGTAPLHPHPLHVSRQRLGFALAELRRLRGPELPGCEKLAAAEKPLFPSPSEVMTDLQTCLGEIAQVREGMSEEP